MPHGDGNVCRSLPNTVKENSTFQVFLDVTLNGSDFYAIDEIIPSNCTIFDAGGGDTSIPGQLKWLVLQGGINTTYSYKVRCEEGTQTFSGEYQVGGMSSSSPVKCDKEITVTENSIYLKPEQSSAGFCDTTEVEVWADANEFHGGQINLTYDPECANVTSWVNSSTAPVSEWDSSIAGREWIFFASDRQNLTGKYLVGTLTIHCVDNSCKCLTPLKFDEESKLFNYSGVELSVNWNDGIFECRCECGDANCNDEVNMGDVILLLNNVTYGYPICNEWVGDVNCNNDINMGDVILLLNNVTYGYKLSCCMEA